MIVIVNEKSNNRFNLSQRFVTVHATRFARLRMNRANSASQVKRMLGRRRLRGARNRNLLMQLAVYFSK